MSSIEVDKMAAQDLEDMMSQKETRDPIGKALRRKESGLRVRYHHMRSGFGEIMQFNDRRRSAIADALERGQVSNHRKSQTSGAEGCWAFTVAIIETDECIEVARGYSFCSAEDQFSRPIGREIALDRALGDVYRQLVRNE